MGIALVNINNIREAEEYIYLSHIHVSLLLHFWSFVEEYNWMISKINGSFCANHSLKDYVHAHTYGGFVLSIHFLSQTSNKYNFSALGGWFCILYNANKFRKYRNGTKCQQLWLSMAEWINLSFLQEQCTSKDLCPCLEIIFIYLLLMLLVYQIYDTLFLVQASWLCMSSCMIRKGCSGLYVT